LRKLGIIGGTSWSSTALYYEHINRGIAKKLGGLHSARLVIESLDLSRVAVVKSQLLATSIFQVSKPFIWIFADR